MSVWEATTYKLDVAQAIYEYVPFLSPKILGPTITPYLQPQGDIVPFDENTTWDEVALECDWLPEVPDEDAKEDILELTKHVTSWSLGMSAVYKLIYACAIGKFQVASQYKYHKIEPLVRAIRDIVGPSTMITPSSFASEWEKVSEAVQNYARMFEDFSEAWKFVTRSIDYKAEEFQMIDQKKHFQYGDRIYYGGYIGKLVIMVGSSEYQNRGLVFTRNHLNMLIEASAKIGNLLDHSCHEYANDRTMLEKTVSILRMTLDAIGNSRGHNADKVAQAFHKARAFLQMKLFNNEMKDSEVVALDEFQKKGLQNIIDLGAFEDNFVGVPKARWLELLNVYKWIPPPDYDSTYAFTELQACHMNSRPSGLDANASTRMQTLWNLIVKERKLNIATAYRKMNGEWPVDLDIIRDGPTEESLDKWTPKNLFPYYSYGKDVTGQIKDRTTVLAKMSEEISSKMKPRDKNFLLWYLEHRDAIDTKEDAQKLLNGTLDEDNYVRVAYKGESHKPGSRLFFMAPPRQRILLGELEGNLSRLARYYPASLQGMDALTRADKLSHLFNVNDMSSILGVHGESTCYVVTFDLSKFSTKFSPSVLKDLHQFWADVFSYEPINAMLKIGSYSTILHTTNGLVMHYQNKGADLEGFRGRMMTLFHADLISAACRLAKAKGYIVGKAISAVFIDDGAVRIAAKGSGAQAKQNALKFLQCMQEVYEAAGQENHPNKTVVSHSGGELLAEQYLHGLKLKCPIKAGMRLYPRYDNPASCITEEFDSLFATIQGSIRDGCSWVVAYRRYAEAFCKSIFRWNREMNSNMSNLQFAFKIVTPKSFGGFGFPTLQALTSTTAYNITIEGLGILNYAARSQASYEPLVRAILEREVVRRDPIHILRDGERVRMAGPILVEGRLIDRIIWKLSESNGPAARLIASLKAEEILEHARQVAIATLSDHAVSMPVLNRVWNCTPLAYTEAIVQKFKRSASITMVLTQKDITNIRRANQRDVKVLCSSYFR